MINMFGSKKEAIGFMKSVTRKDGSVSPTLERAFKSAVGEDESKRGKRAVRALEKIILRHDSNRRNFAKISKGESLPSDIKSKSAKFKS